MTGIIPVLLSSAFTFPVVLCFALSAHMVFTMVKLLFHDMFSLLNMFFPFQTTQVRSHTAPLPATRTIPSSILLPHAIAPNQASYQPISSQPQQPHSSTSKHYRFSHIPPILQHSSATTTPSRPSKPVRPAASSNTPSTPAAETSSMTPSITLQQPSSSSSPPEDEISTPTATESYTVIRQLNKPHQPMLKRSKTGSLHPKFIFNLFHSPLHSEPSSFKSAIQSPEWYSAMEQENHALLDQQTWVLVPKPENQQIIGSKWIFKTKHHLDGSIASHKACLVAQGNQQDLGEDYFETFSLSLNFQLFGFSVLL